MAAPVTLATAREAFERDYIVEVLKQVEGNRTNAANVLGLSRKALWDKCKRYGISSAKRRGGGRMTELNAYLTRRALGPVRPFPQFHRPIP